MKAQKSYLTGYVRELERLIHLTVYPEIARDLEREAMRVQLLIREIAWYDRRLK